MKPGHIEIKDPDVLMGLMGYRFSPALTLIITDVAKRHGLVMTESFREPMHPGDLHSTNPIRAVDLRTWCYPDKKAYEIMHEINKLWEYDPDRPGKMVAIIHNAGQGTHFHIQVHPKTRRRLV